MRAARCREAARPAARPWIVSAAGLRCRTVPEWEPRRAVQDQRLRPRGAAAEHLLPGPPSTVMVSGPSSCDRRARALALLGALNPLHAITRMQKPLRPSQHHGTAHRTRR
jgi:hypothetical protein